MVGKSKDDIKEKGLSADAVYDRATWRRICHRTSTPHESGNKTKRKLKKKNDIHLLVIDHNQCHVKYEEIRYFHVTYDVNQSFEACLANRSRKTPTPIC